MSVWQQKLQPYEDNHKVMIDWSSLHLCHADSYREPEDTATNVQV